MCLNLPVESTSSGDSYGPYCMALIVMARIVMASKVMALIVLALIFMARILIAARREHQLGL